MTPDRAGALAARILALIDAPASTQELHDRDAEAVTSFRAWARGYDRKNPSDTYLAPAILAELAERFLPPGAGPILDLACGTGLIGARLQALGFGDLSGIDLSPEMLAIAASKGVYRELRPANLHEPLPFAPESLAALTCCGAFYGGSVEVRALAHALPLLRPGGHLICDIEMGAWQDEGYARVVQALAAEGWLQILHCEPIRMFRAFHLDPNEDASLPQGMALVARLSG